MKQIHKFILIITLVNVSLGLTGCASTPSATKCDPPEVKKVYLGPIPIQNDQAYKTFLKSSRSETAKLIYVADRIKAARNLTYRYEGEFYNWLEAYSGAMWLLWQDHKAKEEAHAFVRKEALRLQNPKNPTVIQFPDKSTYPAPEILLNELDLLEDTVKLEPRKRT